CYGLGSRDLQPEGLVAAVENMLPDGGHKRFFYLSVDFVRDPLDPREEVRLQELLDAYPHIAELALHGSENPNLLPRDAITVRMHSVGGWGAVTTGKNLSMLMFDLLGYDIRANPKYGSEKKGQPTTYFLSAAPEPIRLNCEYHYVDLVMSPDPNVFTHSNPLFGLQPGGVFIIQSSLGDGDAVWAQIPDSAQQYVVDNDIRVYFLDGFRIARDEASDPELQYRMQGNAFQGAFFAASSVMERAGLDEQGLFRAIEDRLRKKFGSKGERVVQDNLRVVHRGFDELVEITDKPVTGTSAEFGIKVGLPRMLKQLPEGRGGMSDVHRFWEQTGVLYASGRANDNLADPFQAMGIMPASSGVYRDMTQIRFEYPKFVPENCTACGNCFTACPDSAIPGLVNSIGDVFAAAIQRVERTTPTQHLRRETRNVEKKLHAFIDTEGEGANVSQLLDRAVLEHLTESDFQGEQKTVLEQEFGLFLEALEGFQFSITKPYWKVREKKQAGSGGLFSITVNPYTCKGCNECIDVCDDDALVAEPQTQEGVNWLRDNWDIWLDLPTTKPEFIRVDDLDEKVGALETLLLDKHNYQSVMSGDGACMGCGEKTVIHLFTATVTALMQPRVKAHLAEIEDLINRLETHIRLKLASSMDLTDRDAIQQAVASHKDSDLTLGDLSDSLDQEHRATPVDSEWLNWVTGLLDDLRRLRHRYTDGGSGSGRVEMGIVNATGCSSVWGSTFPYNPYPFPWTNHLFQDTASVSLGLFEGHMRNMAEGFRAVRLARLELDGKYDASQHDDFFKRFAWRDFSEEEWRLCPPVVAVGGDGAMYDIGFQNLSRALMTGMPVKIMVLDTQVYSNTGGQACTSGFVSQVSDMAPYGPAWKGKREKRKEMSLIATAHRSAFVLQSSASHVTHLLEGYIDGLNSRRPALFNIYTPCQPEHGIGDDASNLRSRMAVESRAYPLFRFDPDAGSSFHDCCSLETNPSIGEDWITHRISYEDDNGKPAEMEVPFTFADFTLGEGRFRKHFRKAPRDSWNEDMTPVAEYIDLDPDDREGLYPFIWGVDKKNQLMRVLVSPELVASVEERREYWRQLQSIVAEEELVCEEDLIIQRTRSEMAQQLGQALMTLVNGGAAPALGELPSPAIPPVPGVVPGAEAEAAAAEGYEPAWIDTPECTACDECMNINAKIFAYNEEKKATVINPRGGPYKDIVKAAEKCTASCIHPGTPWNPKERGLEKLVKRAAKFQ
ncbi:MAG: 2-oxoacid:acceptor oxidoreductase family protein, partial [Pseudomonadota bacterium]